MGVLSLLFLAAAAPPQYEVVHEFNGPMPTGVTVSAKGRMFVCFPRWGDPVKATVMEVRQGKAVAYPSMKYQPTSSLPKSQRFVSVQSVVVDPKDRLWALDTGSVQFGPTMPGGPKMVMINLLTNLPERMITFPEDVALKTTYLNDVRFDLNRGTEGYAFITDSSSAGPNAIIVVDLASGHSWRRLNEHESVKPVPNFVPKVEGWDLVRRPKPGVEKPINIGSDGIAISPDGERLYYCPLSSRRLYSVAVDALVDQSMTDEQVAATVQEHGEKGAADGLEMDSSGRFYTTDYENASVKAGMPGSALSTIVQMPKRYWPDTLSVRNGYVYLLANQLHRGKDYHKGKDMRIKPYLLVRKKLEQQ